MPPVAVGNTTSPPGPSGEKHCFQAFLRNLMDHGSGLLEVSPMVRKGSDMWRIPELVSVLASGEGVTSDSEVTKEALVEATITAEQKIDGDRVESEDNVISSSDNSKTREEMIRATVVVENRRDSDLMVADSEKDLVLASRSTIICSDNSESREEMVNLVVADSEEDLRPNGGGNGPSQIIRQSSRIKSKGSNCTI
ncbi:hypothetical protein LWI28_027458 [Acer negundo]|uniref:Uncharacterized protein n=1 Tax=Acer negundo TaxID=4023 RepID=A0AAD5NXY1_ACENE|nr:hypothetical protein LWI28_027458 [Acer negundo]